ncbi:unnamed protein product [Phytophthora fragariaefolia]|uniref:Unnamed protein product n=1 Tax=Phytophthora fragariaefolia TaxID=1490495 RepID=A0A9W6WX67_9STRA|nr:unnamed protein product [Phytophthora fragariaefolia]
MYTESLSIGNDWIELPIPSYPGEDRVADTNTATSEPTSVGEDPAPSPKDTSNTRTTEGVLNANSPQEPSASASAPTPAEVPQGQSSPPEDGPDPVNYEESQPDQDREQGEVPDPNSTPQLTEQQRVTRSGSPMTPKTAAAMARVGDQAQRKYHRDTVPTDMPEQQIITNAAVDEGGPPEQLRPDN